MSDLTRVLQDTRTNAVLSWLLAGMLWVTAAYRVLAVDLPWAGFVLFVAVLAVIPAVAYRDWTVMLPWEVLLLTVPPVIGASIGVLSTYASFLTSATAAYVVVSVVALIVAVELHVFTSIEMTHRFAVLFVVITTMAVSGIWTITRWASDTLLGTQFLQSNTTLMTGLITATITGVIAGIVFDLYFRQKRDVYLREQYEDYMS